MSGFAFWFWRPVGEALGVMAFIMAGALLIWLGWKLYRAYHWLKSKFN